MNFLLGLGKSLISSPLVTGVLGSVANGVLDVIKGTTNNVITQGVQAVNARAPQLMRAIDNYQPIERLPQMDLEPQYETRVRPSRKRKRTPGRPSRDYAPPLVRRSRGGDTYYDRDYVPTSSNRVSYDENMIVNDMEE